MKIDSCVGLITNSSTVIYSHANYDSATALLDLFGIKDYRVYVFPEQFYIYQLEDNPEILYELDAVFGWTEDDEYTIEDEIECGTIDATTVDIFADILKRIGYSPSEEESTMFVLLIDGKLITDFNYIARGLYTLVEGYG